MIIFITSSSAFKEMENLILSGQHPVWLTSGILTKEKIKHLYEANINLSVFDFTLNTTNQYDLQSALNTIKEHHPDQNIWVQYENKI